MKKRNKHKFKLHNQAALIIMRGGLMVIFLCDLSQEEQVFLVCLGGRRKISN